MGTCFCFILNSAVVVPATVAAAAGAAAIAAAAAAAVVAAAVAAAAAAVAAAMKVQVRKLVDNPLAGDARLRRHRCRLRSHR